MDYNMLRIIVDNGLPSLLDGLLNFLHVELISQHRNTSQHA